MKTVDVTLIGKCEICDHPVRFTSRLNVHGERKGFVDQVRAVAGVVYDKSKQDSEFYCSLHRPLELRKFETPRETP